MRAFFFLLLAFLLLALSVLGIPQTLNVDFQMHNDTGVVRNTSYSGTVRIYEAGSGSPTYTQAVGWRTDNEGVGNLFLTNLNLKNDVQHELTIQPTGDSESGRLNISGNLQAFFAANSSWAGGVSCSDVLGATSNLCTLVDTDTDTQLTQEQVEDFVGNMVTGNTETGITVTYQDADGTIDFVTTDTSATNEINTFTADSGGSTTGVAVTLTGGGNISTVRSGDTVTFNALLTSLHWNQLTNVPTGLADGDDDTIFDNSGNTANFTTLFGYSADNSTHLKAQNLTLEQLIGFSCGAGDFINTISAVGLPSCGTPVAGGGGAGDKWILNSSLNAIVPNASFSSNIATNENGFGNFSVLYSNGLKSGTQQNITVSETAGVWSFLVKLDSFNWNDLTNIPADIADGDDNTIFDNSGNTVNFTLLFSQTQNNTNFVNAVNNSLSARIDAVGSSFDNSGNTLNFTNLYLISSQNKTILTNLQTAVGNNATRLSTLYTQSTTNFTNLYLISSQNKTILTNLQTASTNNDTITAKTNTQNTFTANQTINAGVVITGNTSINGLFIGKVNATHWRIG